MLTEDIFKLKGMKQLLSSMVVLSLVDKLTASCTNNWGSVYLRFGFSLRQKKLSIDMNPSSGSLDKFQSVRVHQKMPYFEFLHVM